MGSSVRWMVCWVLVLACRGFASAEDKLWLVRDGQSECTIVRGVEDDFAGDRLRRWLADESGARVEVLEAGKAQLPARGCIVALGSVASNPLVKRLCGKLGIQASAAELTEQGYVARRVRDDGRDWLILAGGGRDGTIHAVADAINWHLDAADKNVLIGPCNSRQIPRTKYRWFWNWDHRMDWGGPGKVGSVMGGGGTFSKKPEAFLVDFKNCVDYMADHKFNGLIIWGFLRDTHGGVEATRELCRYAKHRGVRILPGPARSTAWPCSTSSIRAIIAASTTA